MNNDVLLLLVRGLLILTVRDDVNLPVFGDAVVVNCRPLLGAKASVDASHKKAHAVVDENFIFVCI
jgi:hypothetical protein